MYVIIFVYRISPLLVKQSKSVGISIWMRESRPNAQPRVLGEFTIDYDIV